MNHETELTAWQETGAVVRQPASVQPLTPQHASSRAVDSRRLTDLTPADEAEFITTLTPCLQLVAPVGMSPDAQDMWFEAARMALADVPADLLKRGAVEAMQTADHPSKIVPAIMKVVREPMAWRQQAQRYRRPEPEPLALEKHDVPEEERKEVAALVAKLVNSLGDGPIDPRSTKRGETREARA